MACVMRWTPAIADREGEGMLLFMVIEIFRSQDASAVRHRCRDQGRLAPGSATAGARAGQL